MVPFCIHGSRKKKQPSKEHISRGTFRVSGASSTQRLDPRINTRAPDSEYHATSQTQRHRSPPPRPRAHQASSSPRTSQTTDLGQMTTSRCLLLLCTASAAHAFTGALPLQSSTVRRAPSGLSRSLRAESPAEVALIALDSYSGPTTCRNFNRASFRGHFAKSAPTPEMRPQAAFIQQLSAVPLSLIDGDHLGSAPLSAYGMVETTSSKVVRKA